MMWWKLWTRINKTWKGTVWSVWSSEEEVCLCTSLFPEVMFLLVWSKKELRSLICKRNWVWKWLKKKTVKEDMKYCWKTSLGDRLLPNAALQEGGGKSQEGSSSLHVACKWKGISWRAAFDSSLILLLFLLPNPPWVILLDEGLQCWVTCSAAPPCEQGMPSSECHRAGGRLPLIGLVQVLWLGSKKAPLKIRPK